MEERGRRKTEESKHHREQVELESTVYLSSSSFSASMEEEDEDEEEKRKRHSHYLPPHTE